MLKKLFKHKLNLNVNCEQTNSNYLPNRQRKPEHGRRRFRQVPRDVIILHRLRNDVRAVPDGGASYHVRHRVGIQQGGRNTDVIPHLRGFVTSFFICVRLKRPFR